MAGAPEVDDGKQQSRPAAFDSMAEGYDTEFTAPRRLSAACCAPWSGRDSQPVSRPDRRYWNSVAVRVKTPSTLRSRVTASWPPMFRLK
jgi:hypothetical protein